MSLFLIRYHYPLTPGRNYTCGGANRWADLTNSNGTFCPEGFYCPGSMDIRECNKGYASSEVFLCEN